MIAKTPISSIAVKPRIRKSRPFRVGADRLPLWGRASLVAGRCGTIVFFLPVLFNPDKVAGARQMSNGKWKENEKAEIFREKQKWGKQKAEMCPMSKVQSRGQRAEGGGQ